ncbi:MAG: ABC transporter permease [Firmicutes bacterium]|nr:ABC transporter permease [Bacillota bacterium]
MARRPAPTGSPRVALAPPVPSAPAALAALVALTLARARRHWRPYLVVSTAMPAGIVLLLDLVGRLDRAAGSTATVGAMDLVLGITAVTLMAQQVSEAVHNGSFDLLRTLPVAPVLILLALFVSATAFALPGLAVVALLGHALYGVVLRPDAALLPVLLLSGFALGGIGAAVGLAASSEAVAGLVGNLMMMAVLFLGIVPSGHLPTIAVAVRDVLPVGSAVGALGRALSGSWPAAWQWASLVAWSGAGAVVGARMAVAERLQAGGRPRARRGNAGA